MAADSSKVSESLSLNQYCVAGRTRIVVLDLCVCESLGNIVHNSSPEPVLGEGDK